MRQLEKRVDQLEQGAGMRQIVCIKSTHGNRDQALREHGYDPDKLSGAMIFHTIYEAKPQRALDKEKAAQAGNAE